MRSVFLFIFYSLLPFGFFYNFCFFTLPNSSGVSDLLFVSFLQFFFPASIFFNSYIFIGTFFSFWCVHVCGIYICVCTCACGCTHTCVNVKIRVDARCPPQPLSSLFFAAASLTKPVARLAGQWGPERFILTPALKLWSHITGLASACILGIWTQVPMLSWQALNQLSHLPAT